jgi:PAS domain S-box-containing protein
VNAPYGLANYFLPLFSNVNSMDSTSKTDSSPNQHRTSQSDHLSNSDISAENRSSQALRESEERFQAAVKAVQGILWTNNAKGEMEGEQLGWAALTGQTVEEYQGFGWANAVHPEDVQPTIAAWNEAVNERKAFEFEHRVRTRTNQWRRFTIKAVPLFNPDGAVREWVGVHTDVTEQREAEEATKASEERYQNFIRQSTEGIWRFELRKPLPIHVPKEEQIDYFFKHAYLAECNDAMAQMYGYERSQDLDNFNLSHFFKRDADSEAYFNHFIASDYRVQNTESKEIDRHGETRWFSNNLIGIVENGLLYRAWGTQRDITGRKIAEKELAQSEQYFRELIDTVPAMIWITRQDGYCTYLNKNWYDYTGQTSGEAEGFGWLNATHPDDAAEAERLFVEATAKQKPYYILYRLRHKNGTYRWAIDTGYPKFGKEGTFEGMIGTVIDVHEQKLAEDKTKENEEKFRTLAESLPQLVWMTNELGEQEYASSRWKEYTGIEPTGVETWQQIVHPDDLPTVTASWLTSIQSGKQYKTEARLKIKSGEYRWHFVQGEPIKDENGKITKWIGAFTDIHDQKTITAKLEALVTERTKELKRSNEDLQQFAHVASHDLKEPVRKIKTFASRLEYEDQNNLSAAGKGYLQKMQSAADRMSTMIDGVLTYSTLNALHQKIEKVDLSQVISNIQADLELVIQRKEATILQRNLPVIEGAEVLIYQLFYNLINNSLKFSRSDVQVSISITADTIYKDGKSYTEIRIEDNGIGFEPGQAERIFNTFERLHSKDKYDGTGLGLALCKKIAERHGGSITAKGSLNEGAQFIVLLPFRQEQSSI